MNHIRAISVLLGMILVACTAHADDGCGDCGDPSFPEAAEFLASQGYPPEECAVLLTWSERAPLGDGQLVAGYRVRSLPDGEPFDLYSDAQGNLVNNVRLATLGIARKNWDVRPVEQAAELPEAVAKTVAVRPRPVGLAPSETLLVPVGDLDAIKAEDQHAKGPTRIGVILGVPEPVQVDGVASNYGAWQPLADGGRVWSIRILSPDARGMRIHFAPAHVPQGARLIVFNTANSTESYGPYTEDPDVWSATCFSDDVTVECHVPSGISRENLSLTISEIIHVYADFGSLQWGKASVKILPGPCNNDVTCFPAWATTATGVAGLGTVGSNGALFCTGTLLADTVPGTNVPYVLTANHCVSTQTAADSVEIYWLYQTSTCDGSPPDPATVPRTIGGADFLATSPASTGTDFALLRLRNNPPGGIAYVGWTSAEAPVGTSSVCVHHPRGDYKRLTFGDVTNDTLEPYYSSHPRARYHQSLWSDGTTEPGSSGSPLFIESTQQVIGQLWGGLASCTDPSPDYYGRFDVSFPLIESWLDPVTIEADYSSATYTVSETAGAVIITVQLDSAPAGSCSVDYATSNGTATAGQDYTGISATPLTFNSPSTQETFNVTIIDDGTFDEGGETFTVTLSNPTNCTLADTNNPATVTITDNDTSSSQSTVYVDFDWTGDEQGILTKPYNTFAKGLTAVSSGGTIKLDGSATDRESSWTGTINTAMWIELDPSGSPVRIGVSGGASSPPASSLAGEDDELAAFLRALQLALAMASADGDGADNDEKDDDSETAGDGMVHEPVIPYTMTGDGLRAARADSVLAVRLRSEAGIDPDSIWAPAPDAADGEAVVEWRPVQEGDAGRDPAAPLHDVWVLFRPTETWYLEHLITLTAGAETAEGEAVDPATHQFLIESEEETTAEAPVEPIWQPEYGEDFTADELDLSAESNDTAVVASTTTSDPLAEGVDAPFVVGPERVYDVPQRVWLPVPDGVDPNEVHVYYYHTTGDDQGWYPAENVEGWLVPDSYLHLRTNGTTYLGFLVRHAGIVQLGIPRDQSE